MEDNKNYRSIGNSIMGFAILNLPISLITVNYTLNIESIINYFVSISFPSRMLISIHLIIFLVGYTISVKLSEDLKKRKINYDFIIIALSFLFVILHLIIPEFYLLILSEGILYVILQMLMAAVTGLVISYWIVKFTFTIIENFSSWVKEPKDRLSIMLAVFGTVMTLIAFFK